MADSDSSRYIAVVKQDCPTCVLVLPVLEALARRIPNRFAVYVQDDPDRFNAVADCRDDRDLEFSYRHNIEIVPTLIKYDGDRETNRLQGWHKQEWRELTGVPELGEEFIDYKPGCGSLTQDPEKEVELALRYGDNRLQSRLIAADDAADPTELCYERGWSDGLPVVPPTPLRVMKMLRATERKPETILGKIPPDYAPCTVEKAAINAVMAGCKPEYFPVVLTAIEAALLDAFCLHGLLCTTYFSSPVVMVNGAVAKRIGMNSGLNALGQGNRANATIGRALQLVVRNVGGGRPGEIDRATLGNPGKYTFCFAEDESDSEWQTLAEDQGFARSASTVSLFAGDGVQPIVDQRSRSPESLVKTFAESLRVVAHAKLYGMADAILVVSPEHRRVFRDAGWSKAQLAETLRSELKVPGANIVRGANSIAEGMPTALRDKTLDKFRPGGLHIVTAGGTAGMFSAIISGWVATGPMGSQLVTEEIVE